VVKHHNGLIKVHSNIGEGSTFDVYLPASGEGVKHQGLNGETLVGAMIAFFQWCLKHGSEAATRLNYVPIPKKIHEMILEVLNEM
jgi:hypothetical protein